MNRATDIRDDLRAIHAILIERGGAHVYEGKKWWGTPADPKSIAALNEVYGPIPDDVIGFYEVTDVATFGPFWGIGGPDLLLGQKENALALYGDAVQETFPAIFADNKPQGVGILPMSTENNASCLIELGGPDHGRVISPWSFEQPWRTLAWSLSDAIACLRELYESGWYDWYDQTYSPWIPTADPQLDQDEELERLRPIIDNWNCNPIIAGFDAQYGYEPKRPNR